VVANKVDKTSPVPPHRQVAGFLAAGIESGQYPPGARLPSIADLVQTYGIARATAGKVLHDLVADGLAEISPGMGTYVSRREPNAQKLAMAPARLRRDLIRPR
jgi:DNA-binding GntR family transcriptional regulator